MMTTAAPRLDVFVVLNPVASNCDPKEVRHHLRKLEARGLTLEIHETARNEDTSAFVSAALDRGATLVVAAGGDGAVSAAAQAVIARRGKAVLGIIPVGASNVLARELGIPLNVEAACWTLAERHQLRVIDAIKVGKRFYLFQVGIGLDSLMIRDTPRRWKRMFGRLAYFWTAAGEMRTFRPRKFSIRIDGAPPLHYRATEVLVANGGSFAEHGLSWGPNIAVDDQSLKLCVVRPRSVWDYFGLIVSLLLGETQANQNVLYFEVRDFARIVSYPALPVQADGEIIGETPIHVQLAPRALAIVTPIEELAGEAEAG